MKKNIFDVLMEIKTEVFNARKSSGQKIVSVAKYDGQEVMDFVAEHDEQFLSPDGNLLPTLRSKSGVLSSLPETHYFEIKEDDCTRKIAYTVSGDLSAENILICLPGLLETKASFAVIHAYFLKFKNCKVISIDFSGRGESDSIGEYGAYKMSLYLSDISQLIREVVVSDGAARQRITLLGTSMGGVLAMYLTQIFGRKIYEIILNDIALTVNWTSLYALYKEMKNDLGFREVRELAKDLSVDEKAISDVQLPGHFDLSYQADVWGMNFHESLKGYEGKVGLIYGSNSKICTKQRVEEAKNFIPHLQILQVPGAGHPAPFNLLVCGFIQSQIGV